MSYALAADLRLRFGDAEIDLMANRSSLGANVAIEHALMDASNEIDAYLSGNHDLPLVSVPPMLVRIACDIARYRLWSDRASEEVRQRYEDARRFLESLAKGAVRLPQNDGQIPPSEPSMAAARAGDAPIFSRQGTEGY
jgi:phage gp36-like protein